MFRYLVGCFESQQANTWLSIFDRFSRDRPRFTDNLDVIKFLCKDLWSIVFRKQVDNLKTNHRVRTASRISSRFSLRILCGYLLWEALTRVWAQGVYVLTDNAFRPFTRMSMAIRSDAVARAEAVRDRYPNISLLGIRNLIKVVSLVPMWFITWWSGKHGNHCNRSSRDIRSARSYISNQGDTS